MNPVKYFINLIEDNREIRERLFILTSTMMTVFLVGVIIVNLLIQRNFLTE